MKKRTKCLAAGTLAGAVNGLFGGGGGIPLALALRKWVGLDEKAALATCVGCVLPFCLVSAGMYALRGALPYLLGGLIGGQIGGKLFQSVSELRLRQIFALFLLYGAGRYLLW